MLLIRTPLIFSIVPVLLMMGCSSAPLSFVRGEPLSRADGSLYPVKVVSVDGKIQFGGRPDGSIELWPGVHSVVFVAAPGSGARGTVQRTFMIKVEPCTYYHYAAKRDSVMDANWSLVLDRAERVAGCNAEEELRKASQAKARGGS